MAPEHLSDIPVVTGLESVQPGVVLSGELDRGELSLDIAAESLVPVCRWLKDVQKFDRLADLTAVDWPSRELRFEVVYHLHSFANNERLRLKCRLAGHTPAI